MLGFKDAPPAPPMPGMADKIMHAALKIGDSRVMMSDVAGKDGASQANYRLSLATDDLNEGERYFQALAQGWSVTMSFQKTFWAEGFGMAIDRFGIPWIINVPQA